MLVTSVLLNTPAAVKRCSDPEAVGGFVGPEGEKLLISRLDRLLADTHR